MTVTWRCSPVRRIGHRNVAGRADDKSGTTSGGYECRSGATPSRRHLIRCISHLPPPTLLHLALHFCSFDLPVNLCSIVAKLLCFHFTCGLKGFRSINPCNGDAWSNSPSPVPPHHIDVAIVGCRNDGFFFSVPGRPSLSSNRDRARRTCCCR